MVAAPIGKRRRPPYSPPSARQAALRTVPGFVTLLIGRLVLFTGTHPLPRPSASTSLKADAPSAAAGLPVFALICHSFAELFGALPI